MILLRSDLITLTDCSIGSSSRFCGVKSRIFAVWTQCCCGRHRCYPRVNICRLWILHANRAVRSIVAVHGLNGHRETTWGANDVNWLRDFLPADLPNARILTWGYDADTHSTSQISFQYLYNHATTLVSDLCLERSLTKV